MKNSLAILLFFAVGVLMGNLGWFNLAGDGASTYALYFLMLLVGVSIGTDPRVFSIWSRYGIRILLLPLGTIIGTLGGISLLFLLIPSVGYRELLAVGAGFGYYSLSSIIISEMHSESLGVVALLSNIIREVVTLLTAPLMVYLFGKLAPIAGAGATSMDTTLPVILHSSGKEVAVLALAHGIVLTILVPLLVPLILGM